MASQLNDYVISSGLENVNQSAHKHSHSTKTVLVSIKNEVHLALARGKATTVVLLNQSAAFDTINHRTLTELLIWCLRCGFRLDQVVPL